jgi:DNA-binding transcriptional MerR regulator
MKILTTDEILAAVGKKGIDLSRKTFRYYLKLGLLFAQDRKTKKRLREGIISLYAEEVVERLERIFEFKASGETLEEIRAHLEESDRTELAAIYAEASIEPTGADGEDKTGGIATRVLRWKKDGYYCGLLGIYDDLLTILKDRLAAKRAEATGLDELKGSLSWQVCHQDKSAVEGVLDRKIKLLNNGLAATEQFVLGIETKRRALIGLLTGLGEEPGPHVKDKQNALSKYDHLPTKQA